MSLQDREGDDAHLKTEHLKTGLRRRTISGGIIGGLSQAFKFVLNLGSVMILSRLLTPADFGLVAIVGSIVGFLRAFREMGLSTATVQREDITNAQISNLFWLNVGVGLAMTLCVASCSSLVGWFFSDERLPSITLVLSITFVIGAASVQHQALLQRSMRFMARALIDSGATLFSAVAAIVMALSGYGYWSLVVSVVVLEGLTFLLSWIASGWRPNFPRRNCGTRPLVVFGVHLTVGGFFYSMARGADNILIGRFFGPEAVGIYSRGSLLLSRPIEQFLTPINAVFVPALSRLQGEPERYRRMFLSSYNSIVLLSMPLAALLLTLAHPITLLVLGPKWESASTVLAAFSIVAIYSPAASTATWLLTSQGRGRSMLATQTVISSLILAAFVCGIPFGVEGVAWIYSVSGILIRLPVVFHYSGQSGPISSRDLWKPLLSGLPVWGVVVGTTLLVRSLFVMKNPAVDLAVSGSLGMLAGTAFVLLSPSHRRGAHQIWNVARTFGSKISVNAQ